ncbi:hypothetical protein SCHPADRAFT_937709 [Schizopora paradoxa]|uniref:BTB domain-containing protein n=1 Tax=Schizopora paradoxa TaxID=27342 RepID=A0A0H2RX74_9AGAM|nr:hypothetical protein SCHPADRAFT_937709 [Schizopora paradoxa]
MAILTGNAPKPHELLWFSDGSVVLSTDLYLFKVHKSLLALHSSAFKDMIQLLNVDGSDAGEICIAGAQDVYEGLPLVTLVGDKGEDVVHLLRTVYELNYHDRHSNDTSLQTVVALLLQSTKYDFKAIRDNVIMQLSRNYPMNLSDYMVLVEERLPQYGMKHRRQCHITLLAAAFKSNADVLLPTLYFDSADLLTENLLDESGLLPPECFRTLMIGRDLLHEAIRVRVTELPELLRDEAYDGFEDAKNICLKEGGPCLSTIGYERIAEFCIMCFTLRTGAELVVFYLNSMCSTCTAFMANEFEKMRDELWARVPSFIGCPEWSVLKEKFEEIAED